MKRYILALAALSFCVACEQHVAVPETSTADKSPVLEEKKVEPASSITTPAAEAPAPAAPVEEKKPEATPEPAAPAAPAAEPAAEEKKPEAPAAEPKP
jgi:hypothetical protein